MASVVIDSKSFGDAMKNYAAGDAWLQDLEVEFVDGPAEVDALTLLRAYQAEWNLDSGIPLASAFCINRTIIISRQGKRVMTLAYRGGNFAAQFNDAPYLLDVVLKACYSIMLKKLTPPSDDSENVGEE